jgi:D-alanyl-D-alanine carboxypeptidase (penicillin-binding protein 5/6)
MYPASMTKMMTAYLMFERLKEGSLTLQDSLLVSEKAWRKGGSKMFVKVKDRVLIEDLLNGVIVQSGNDASIVIAEAIAGTEEAFAKLMNEKAAQLGMTGTHFVNATGWPDTDHYTTIYDLALLSRATIQNFPEYYHYFSKKEYTYNNITQHNRNRLLDGELNVDGLKTGHTEQSGYGIATSAEQNGQRLIAVVSGLTSDMQRASSAEGLLRYGFNYFTKTRLVQKNVSITSAPVWYGTSKTVSLVTKEDIISFIPRYKEDDITASAAYTSPIVAPIKAGQALGTITLSIPGIEKKVFTLYAADDVAKSGALQQAGQTLHYLLP